MPVEELMSYLENELKVFMDKAIEKEKFAVAAKIRNIF
jgi:hypothetical protein